MSHPVWIEVEKSALDHNLRQVRGMVGEGVLICAVVKADAYGHGAVEASRIFLASGADMVAVTRVDEAAELRAAGITEPILVLDSSPAESARTIVELGLQQTVCTRELASALSAVAVGLGKVAKVHVKIDSGMGRLGLLPEEVPDFVRYLVSLPAIEVAGTYTHFSRALEPNIDHTKIQLKRFLEAVKKLKDMNLPTGTVHAANSAAMLRLPEARLDMVRPGTILYGQYPSKSVPKLLNLKSGWTLKGRISFVKQVPPGSHIGYGGEFRTKRTSKIAIIPIGFADGFTVMPESLARRQFGLKRSIIGLLRKRPPLTVLVRGVKAPIVGRVAMQMCALDVTDVQGVEVGDEVVIPSRRVTMSSRIPRVVI